MTLRRYAPMRQSLGTPIPLAVRREVQSRDGLDCVGRKVGMPGECSGSYELDHVRTGGMGRKSESVASNLVRMCSGHHRYKTENGRVWRPRLVAYLAAHP